MPVMPNPGAARTRVALFRAREDGASSAARLRRLGFSVACLPATEVAPLSFTLERPRYDGAIATSARAFLVEVPLDPATPLFVVGAGTARAAEARGFRLAAAPARDSERLAATLKGALPPGAAVLYLAGRDRKTTVESALAGAAALEVVEVYAAEARERWRPAEVRALGACAFALHYSRRSAALAVKLAQTAGAAARFRRMTHVCLSADVAKALEAIEAARTRIAVSPHETALFAALIEAATVFPSSSPSRI